MPILVRHGEMDGTGWPLQLRNLKVRFRISSFYLTALISIKLYILLGEETLKDIWKDEGN